MNYKQNSPSQRNKNKQAEGNLPAKNKNKNKKAKKKRNKFFYDFKPVVVFWGLQFWSSSSCASAVADRHGKEAAPRAVPDNPRNQAAGLEFGIGSETFKSVELEDAPDVWSWAEV